MKSKAKAASWCVSPSMTTASKQCGFSLSDRASLGLVHSLLDVVSAIQLGMSRAWLASKRSVKQDDDSMNWLTHNQESY